MALHDPDDEGFAGGVDDFACDRVELVDVHDAMDLRHQPGGEPEIAAGDADDRGAGLAGGEVFGVVEAEVGPLTRQSEGLFVAGQGLVVVQESDAAVAPVASTREIDLGSIDADAVAPPIEGKGFFGKMMESVGF